MIKKLFILYDARARDGDTSKASVVSTAKSEREARREGENLWNGCCHIWYQYRSNKGSLTDEKMRKDIPPG